MLKSILTEERSTNFICLQGTKIYASCKKTYLGELGKHLRVGLWRNIDRFSVSAAGGAFRSTNHKYRIALNGNTKITESSHRDDNIFLNLVDFKTIERGDLDSNILIGKFLKQILSL